MLSADKDKLEREYRKRMLQIRERELVYYISNSNNIATLSALLLGCTVSFLIDQANESFDLNCVDLSSGDDILDCSEQVLLGNGGQGSTHYVSELLLPFLILFCTFQTSLSCWGSMLISMLAPRLVLHGPPSLAPRSTFPERSEPSAVGSRCTVLRPTSRTSWTRWRRSSSTCGSSSRLLWRPSW